MIKFSFGLACATVMAMMLGTSTEAAVTGVTLGQDYAGTAMNTGTTENPSLQLVAGGWAKLDITMSGTGVQRLGYDLGINSTDSFLDGYYNGWKGLSLGSFAIMQTRGSSPQISIAFDAAATNSAPTATVNAGDLILVGSFGGAPLLKAGYAAPSNYHSEWDFNYDDNTTTFRLTSGATTFVDHIWSSVFPASALDFYATAWTTDGNGAILNVSNVTMSPVPEPATVGIVSLVIGSVLIRRRRAV